jgi:hypothetical protein
MRKFVVAFWLVAAGACGASAQDYYFGVTYDPSLPLGDTQDFAGDFGWFGLSLEGRKLVRPEASVGFLFAWHEMDKDSDEVVNLGQGVDAQAEHRRFINSFPMMVNGHYYFGTAGRLRPHIGLNVGAYLIERRVDTGLFLVDEDTWHFGIAPEAGLAWRAGWQSAGIVSVRFNWASPGGDSEEMYLNFRVGMAWM